METQKAVMLVVIGSFLAFAVAVAFCGCATTVPAPTTVGTSVLPVQPDPAPVVVEDVGPRFLSLVAKFGQVERDYDCELAEEAVEQRVSYILERAGVPQPENLVVKMIRPSSLCADPLTDDGFIRLAEIGLTMRWRNISSAHFAQAKALLDDLRYVSSILP